MDIRACRHEDLAALEWGGEFTHDRSLIEMVHDLSRAGTMAMLVADAGDELVGQVWVDFARSEDVATLWALRVRPAWRRHGVGSALLAAAEALARGRSVPFTELEVEPANTVALELYVRRGYSEAGRDAVGRLVLHKRVTAAHDDAAP
jgi:ribosomal protein S18 acetylase RimI-like enzyme